jgi:glycosyltransferase involved in cell wall biosynthesis
LPRVALGDSIHDVSVIEATRMVRRMPHQNASADATLISIIITCFNHARYLPEAIESAVAQSYETTEIIVVDDGSTDHTSTVLRAYPSATYIYQENQGLAAARNTGWRACRGDFVVFLDADDRLLPDALSDGLSCLQANPECAFVSGHFRYIKADGSFLREFAPASVDRDHYRAFLRGNYVAMHATVMYRRAVLEWAGGFNTSLDACEDYDLYLRIARQHPICCHATVVAEYRQHNANMSGDAGLMLRTAVEVLRSQQAYVDAEGSLRKAFRVGLRSWILHYGKHLIRQLFVACRHRDLKQALRALAILFHYCPYYFSTSRRTNS